MFVSSCLVCCTACALPPLALPSHLIPLKPPPPLPKKGSFSNISRSNDGSYVAVSSRGNFYLTWAPGQAYWQPHNRPTARRVQNMGWTPANRLWLTTRGGDVLTGDPPSEGGEAGAFENAKLSSRGFGVLDVGFLDADTAFACGGSGSLFKSVDGGRSWKRDRSTDDVAGNLYSIRFFGGGGGGPGFILGNDGILLRYVGSAGGAGGAGGGAGAPPSA